LRAAVVPNASPKEDFAGVINALKTIGISKEQHDDLHKLRTLYNDVKHDPTTRPSISDALEQFRKTHAFASDLPYKKIERVHSEVPRRFHRILRVAGWDHYIGGDTEAHLLFPTDDPDAPSIDSIDIRINAWQEVIEDLKALGKVTPGQTPRAGETKGIALTSKEAQQFPEAAKTVCVEYYPLFLTALRAGLRRGSWSRCNGATSSSERTTTRIALSWFSTTACGANTPRRRARRVGVSIFRASLENRCSTFGTSACWKRFSRARKNIADDLVFPSPEGAILDPDNLYHRYFQPVLTKDGLRKYSPARPAAHIRLLAAPEWRHNCLRERADGPQLDSGHSGHLRPPDSRRQRIVCGSPGRNFRAPSKTTPPQNATHRATDRK
jgi:hypothetical protein